VVVLGKLGRRVTKLAAAPIGRQLQSLLVKLLFERIDLLVLAHDLAAQALDLGEEVVDLHLALFDLVLLVLVLLGAEAELALEVAELVLELADLHVLFEVQSDLFLFVGQGAINERKLLFLKTKKKAEIGKAL